MTTHDNPPEDVPSSSDALDQQLRALPHFQESARFPESDPSITDNLPSSPALGPMPRRPSLVFDAVGNVTPRLTRRAKPFKATLGMTLRRLYVWLYGLILFFGGVFWDQVKGRNTTERQAVRLRQTINQIGGTFIKFGQQASIRVDLLPYAYCTELTKLLDTVPPFPTNQAIKEIEQLTGKPLSETFERFDPEPIGAASIACVYQARLKNGDRVAIKVRRPGIGEQFAADLRVMGWLFGLMELLTFVRSGLTDNVLQELRETLLEELDFYKEARYQSIFRQRAAQAPRDFFTAPEVYPELSGEAVITQAFVSGIWLSELLAAVEHQDETVLESLQTELQIDPKVVAKRLLWVSHWGVWSNIFFHADPHPANIIVQPNNQLVFIDFGAVGSLSSSRRLTLYKVFNLEAKEDVETIARVTLALLEPLPPVDVDKVLNAIQTVYWEALIATRSGQSAWWERTSAQLWLGFFKVTNQFQIPMSFDTLRMIRATLLYDTLAARLDNDIDIGAQYRAYLKDAGQEARQRFRKSLTHRLRHGFDDQDFLKLEELADLGEQVLYQTQRLLSSHTYNFGALVGKFVSAILMVFNLAFQILIITGIIIVGVAVAQLLQYNLELSLPALFVQVISNIWYQLLLVFLILMSFRRILLRLADKEV
ncbi:MAG: AarF/UbiB family protein [Chloroflexota bacterium]